MGRGGTGSLGHDPADVVAQFSMTRQLVGDSTVVAMVAGRLIKGPAPAVKGGVGRSSQASSSWDHPLNGHEWCRVFRALHLNGDGVALEFDGHASFWDRLVASSDTSKLKGHSLLQAWAFVAKMVGKAPPCASYVSGNDRGAPGGKTGGDEGDRGIDKFFPAKEDSARIKTFVWALLRLLQASPLSSPYNLNPGGANTSDGSEVHEATLTWLSMLLTIDNEKGHGCYLKGELVRDAAGGQDPYPQQRDVWEQEDMKELLKDPHGVERAKRKMWHVIDEGGEIDGLCHALCFSGCSVTQTVVARSRHPSDHVKAPLRCLTNSVKMGREATRHVLAVLRDVGGVDLNLPVDGGKSLAWHAAVRGGVEGFQALRDLYVVERRGERGREGERAEREREQGERAGRGRERGTG